jgi:hypothetical protein
MNKVFCGYMDDLVVCNVNDIFIISKNMEENEQHVWLVLDKLRKVGLYVKLEKCEFHQTKSGIPWVYYFWK